MHAQAIFIWLRRRSRQKAAFDFIVCTVLLLCCFVLLGITGGFGYLIAAVLQFIFGSVVQEIWRADLPYFPILNWAFALVLLLVMFMAQIRKERELMGEFMELRYVAGRDSFFPWVVKMSVYTAGEVFGKIAVDVVLIGPRLSFFTYSMFRRATRLCTLDYWRCAQILEALLRRGKRMSFAELEEIVPDADRFHVFDQLRDIEGVVFLLGEPAGISLVQDLRTELRTLRASASSSAPPLQAHPRPKAEFRPPKEPPKVALPTELGQCYLLLGITAKASSDQIRDAYRRKIKECHPDLFMRFGQDWQRMAEDRSKQINHAYDMIRSRR